MMNKMFGLSVAAMTILQKIWGRTPLTGLLV
jgi:hypothetical protein